MNDKLQLTSHKSFCIFSENCMYHSERKLTVHNILLITHGLFKMENNICRVVHGVREERL